MDDPEYHPEGAKMSNSVDNPEAYFRTFIRPREELLLRLEQEAREEDIPIIGPIVGELLFILVKTMGARRIMELGTATGYSAIFLACGCRAVGGHVVTLENNPRLAERAKNNLRSAGVEKTVEVVTADALEALAEMAPPFDLIFIDIQKEDYIRIMPHCHRLLRPGGLLVADNVSYRGADTFNRAIFADKRWRSLNLYGYLPLHSPEKDAVCLAVRL